MNMTKEIKDTLALQNPQEKVRKLEQLSDVFEYGHGLSKEDVIEETKLLLAAILREKDQSVKDQLFYTLYTSVVHQDIGDRIDWDILVDILPALNKLRLEEALGILGLSGQERYLHILDEYMHSADPEIREWALNAIGEIKYRQAHASEEDIVWRRAWNAVDEGNRALQLSYGASYHEVIKQAREAQTHFAEALTELDSLDEAWQSSQSWKIWRDKAGTGLASTRERLDALGAE